MAITYNIGEYDPLTSSTVEVTYINSENGFEHKRTLNIPRLDDGSGEIDIKYFNEILEGQLRGVENKLRLGVISFTDPNEIPEIPAPLPLPETPASPEVVTE